LWLCFTIFIVAAGFGTAWCGTPEPRAFVSEARFDFGHVPEGPTVTHRFAIENRGEGPLHILDAKASCGCTRLDYEAGIAPGRTGYIEAVLKTEGDGGRSVQITIDVQTDDPRQSRFRLHLVGGIEKVVHIAPSIVRFEGVAGRPLTREVVIQPTAKYPFRILSVDTKKGACFSCELSREQRDRHPVYRLTVNMDQARKGRYFDKIIIRTDSPYRPEIKIGVFAKIV
jgi:hypothetical protein